jgi:hypothetical protein
MSDGVIDQVLNDRCDPLAVTNEIEAGLGSGPNNPRVEMRESRLAQVREEIE